MDNPESTDVLDLLSRLSQDNNTAICCILHENKSSADSNMRGHLGTELINKCTEEYQVTKKDNVITIEQTVSRDAPLYDKLEFTIEEDGMPSEIAIAMKTHKNSIQKQSPRPITGGSFSLTKAVTPEKSCTVSLWRAERKPHQCLCENQSRTQRGQIDHRRKTNHHAHTKRGFDLSVGIVLCMRLYRRLYTNHNFMQEKPPLLAVFPPITIKTADNYEKQIGCKS